MDLSPSLVATFVLEVKLHSPAFSNAEDTAFAPFLSSVPPTSINPAVAAPATVAPTTPSISGLPDMALPAIWLKPPATAPAAIFAKGPASGPSAPVIAPVMPPTTADCAISPNEVGLPCMALETTVTPTLTAAPTTAPTAAVMKQRGKQCPLGSFRVSGLSPT